MDRFTVSEGRSRTATKWKPQDYSWEEFLERLRTPIRTRETAAQYAAASRDEQAAAKDVGGFVGGTLSGERRSAQAVMSRTLITLDADYASESLPDDLEWSIPGAAALYSTHSHTPEKPRYRIIIPLSRPIAPEEYEPVARLIARDIGLRNFDPTTFQASRLMYWPSVSQDGEYIFREYEGDPLDVDAMLARYADWHDVSSWPACPTESDLTARKSTCEDPLEKPGVIGAFCRTYTIPDAIDKFLPEIYTPTDGFENRYTYAGGSTSGGLILFDGGTLALSYHATDPANTGHEVNAFDLVRLHLFGQQDARCRESTPVENRASYKAMLELATKDPETTGTIISERMPAAEAFAAYDDPDDKTWTQQLDLEKNGQPANTIKNVHLIMQNDPALKGAIAYNEFSSQVCIVKPLPWHKHISNPDGDPWQDRDDIKLKRYLERYRSGFTSQNVIDQVTDVADTHAYNPVKAYLNSLEWDGVERLDTLLIDCLGAETTPETKAYVRAVTRKTLVGAVARVMEPGCMMQYTLVLTGPQGIGKSTLISDLAGRWFSDNVYGIGTKEAQDLIQGYWIIEMSELAATRKVDVENLKSFLSSPTDTYRAAYGRRKEEHPRQCIFIGTTNSDAFLRDETGNRRYWPVAVKKHCKRLTQDEVDQIWAEAKARYEAGETLYLPKDLEAVARIKQGHYKLEDPWISEIQEYLDQPIPIDWYSRSEAEKRAWLDPAFGSSSDVKTMRRDTVTAAEVWTECLGGNPRELKKNMAALHQAMSGLKDWTRIPGRTKFQGRSVNVYRRDQAMQKMNGKVVPISRPK